MRKVTRNQSLIDNGIELSVRHIKQHFKFGHGPNAFITKAVDDVSFDIKKGECFGLVGESGCGKTTTGRSLIKLYNITDGDVYFEGERISAGTKWHENEIKRIRKEGAKEKKELKNKHDEDLKNIDAVTADLSKVEGLLNEVNAISEELAVVEKEIADLKKEYEIKLEESNRIADEAEKASVLEEVNNTYSYEVASRQKRMEDLSTKVKHLQSQIEAIKSMQNSDKEGKTAAINQKYNAELALINSRIEEAIREEKEAIAQAKFDNRHVNKKLLNKMQMIFQDPVDSLDPRMTVEDIIQEGLHIQGQYDKYKNSMKVKDALVKVGLLPEYSSRYPHEFSGGQRQRIGIARALIMNPSFLICDEPISALDVSIRAQIINLLNDLKEEMGLTMLFIAHDLSVVKYFCDRIAVMYFGHIVELASSDELFKHPLHPYTNALLSAIPKPDPLSEKVRKRYVYVPARDHDYSKEMPTLVEIVPGHFVLANSEEIEKYKKKLKEND